MKVHEIMTANPRTVAPSNSLVEAAGLMRELDVGALPVYDQDQLGGIVTDRDIVVRGVADGKDPNTTTVSEVMSGGLEFVFADQEVEEATRVMEERRIRRLPVLDRMKKLVGMLSLGDIAMSSNPAFSGMALRDVSEPNQPTARQRRLARQSEPSRVAGRTRTQASVGGGRRRSARSGAAKQRGGAGSRRRGAAKVRRGGRGRSVARASRRRKSSAGG